MKKTFFALLFAAACVTALAAGPATITVQVDKPGIKVSPTLWGIFFEDINCSADGGLYAEMVRNRSFEDSTQPEYWSLLSSGPAKVEMKIDSSRPAGRWNTNSLKFTVTDPGRGRVGVVNNGYWGMALEKGEVYNLSLQARGGGSFGGPLTVTMESSDGLVYHKETINDLGADWKNYKFPFNSTDTDPRARLVISTTKPGTFWLDMVSMFPEKTWKGRNNGLRPDLAEMLAGLKSGFMRFPGGCWVEGQTMATSYRWKQTIGDPAARRTQYNLWNYYATHGIGFHEYLQLAEDLHAEPLFVINCGMSHEETVPMSDMGEYVQDALDAIEYCNGPVDSKWGSLRAKNGHPEPFNLKYMEIGNENGGRAYAQRYPLFVDAIKTKYPEVHLITDVWGGVPTNRPVEIKDEHYYDTPDWFLGNFNHYDKYDRKGPKVYVGEYAATVGVGLGNLRAAVGEAAFMMGMERNSDVVVMASYAPLFVNVNHRGWNPDLIDYDNTGAYGIPSYYLQKMFGENQGNVVLPVKTSAPVIPGEPVRGQVGVGTWRTRAEYKDIQVTRDGKTLFRDDFADGTRGWRFWGGDWETENGVLRQNAGGDNIRSLAGDENWTDYTYSLKARKLGGDEGFLILFGNKPGGGTTWWNVGGWGNTEEGLQIEGGSGKRTPCKIETNRWYDVRVELKGTNVKCYLDDKLVRDENIDASKPSLFASATRVNAGGEVIVKVVNASAEPLATEIKLDGVSSLTGPARATVLSSEKPTDENTLAEPKKVFPVTKTLSPAGTSINDTFPGNSVTVIRVGAR